MAKKTEIPEGMVVVRKKRAPSKYNIELGKLMKKGMSMAEANAELKKRGGAVKAKPKSKAKKPKKGSKK